MFASPGRKDPSQNLLAPALIVLAAVAAYHGSYSVPFFFDDVFAITNNPTIRHLSSLADVLSPPAGGGGVTGRPLVNLSLALNHAMGGFDVRSYHALNLIFHSISALALLGLVRRTLALPPLHALFPGHASSLAFTIALLWTLHPLQTESVACVIQRTELMMGMFYLLTLYSFIRRVDDAGGMRWSVAAVTFSALGMATKEVMVSAPLIVLLYDRTFVAGTFRRAWQTRRAFYGALAATWLVLISLLAGIGGTRGEAAGFGLGMSSWSYLLKQAEAIVMYLKLSLWPHPLVLDYGTSVVTDPVWLAPQFSLVLLLVIVTLVALKVRPAIGFTLFSFFAILAPSSSVLPLVSQTMAEHRMYLPLAAVLTLAVTGAHRIGGKRVFVVAPLAALALGAVTAARVEILQDEVALWFDTIAKVPANPRAHGSLGLALSQRGRPDEAIPHFQRSLELDPKSVGTEQNIGNAYFRLDDFSAAAAHYRRAVELDPKFAAGFNNLGAAWWELHDTTAALQAYRTALDLDPHHVGAHRNLGRALFALNRFADALPHYAEVLRQQPDSPDAHYDLGLALARTGDSAGAARHFDAALRLRPAAGSYLNYARFLANDGRIAEAISKLETALQLQPDFAEARRELERLRTLKP